MPMLIKKEQEFVMCHKSRPFAVLVSPNLPTPSSSYIDHHLAKELGLRITDISCKKMSFAGKKNWECLAKFRLLLNVWRMDMCLAQYTSREVLSKIYAIILTRTPYRELRWLLCFMERRLLHHHHPDLHLLHHQRRLLQGQGIPRADQSLRQDFRQRLNIVLTVWDNLDVQYVDPR